MYKKELFLLHSCSSAYSDDAMVRALSLSLSTCFSTLIQGHFFLWHENTFRPNLGFTFQMIPKKEGGGEQGMEKNYFKIVESHAVYWTMLRPHQSWRKILFTANSNVCENSVKSEHGLVHISKEIYFQSESETFIRQCAITFLLSNCHFIHAPQSPMR